MRVQSVGVVVWFSMVGRCGEVRTGVGGAEVLSPHTVSTLHIYNGPMVVDPFTAAAAGVVVGGYFLVRGLVRLFGPKAADVAHPTAAKAEIPMSPPVAPREVVVAPAPAAVQRGVTIALKVASSVVETAVVLSRGVNTRVKAVGHSVHDAVAFSKAGTWRR